jgi:hypothetical protein
MFRQPEVPCLVVVSQLPHPFLGDSLYVIMCFTGLAKNNQRADGGNWAIGSTEWPLAQAGRNQEVQYSVVFNFFCSGWWRSLFWLGCVATRAASGFCWCPTLGPVRKAGLHDLPISRQRFPQVMELEERLKKMNNDKSLHLGYQTVANSSPAPVGHLPAGWLTKRWWTISPNSKSIQYPTRTYSNLDTFLAGYRRCPSI